MIRFILVQASIVFQLAELVSFPILAVAQFTVVHHANCCIVAESTRKDSIIKVVYVMHAAPFLPTIPSLTTPSHSVAMQTCHSTMKKKFEFAAKCID